MQDMQNQIITAVAAVIAQSIISIQTQFESQESQRLSDLLSQQNQAELFRNDTENPTVQFSFIEFFDFLLSEKNNSEDVMQVEKNIFY